MSHFYNAYNSKDAQVLLELKRQESQAILDIVRCTQPNTSPMNLILIVVNTIRAQIGVKRLAFFLYDEITQTIKLQKNFGFDLKHIDFSFLNNYQEILEVSSSSAAHSILIDEGVEFVIPILRNNQPMAWFLIADFADTPEEQQNDLIFIETVGTILVIALDNARLFENQIKQQRLNQELELAEQIQSHLLPKNLSVHPELEIAAFIKPHYKVGGDFFDIIKISEEEIFFCIADVSGKGISSALLVSSLQAHIHAHIYKSNPSLKSIVGHLNKSLLELTGGDRYVTIFLGLINFKKKSISYVNAGHPPPVFFLKGKIVHLENGCMPLGAMQFKNIEVGNIPFYSGDVLFCYTDGFSEQENPKGDFLGIKPIVEYLKMETIHSVEQFIKDAYAIHQQFRKHIEPHDDTTLLAIKFL